MAIAAGADEAERGAHGHGAGAQVPVHQVAVARQHGRGRRRLHGDLRHRQHARTVDRGVRGVSEAGRKAGREA